MSSGALLRGIYRPFELLCLTWCRCETKQACLDPSRGHLFALFARNQGQMGCQLLHVGKQQHLSTAKREVCF